MEDEKNSSCARVTPRSFISLASSSSYSPAGAAAAIPGVLERVASFPSVASTPRSTSGEGVPFEVLLFVGLAGEVALRVAPETFEDVVELLEVAKVEDEEEEDELLLLEVVLASCPI